MCVISHNHYDHLDVDSVKDLNKHHQHLIWMVPLGMKEWMINLGVQNVVELDWSEKVTLNDQSQKNRIPLTLHCKYFILFIFMIMLFQNYFFLSILPTK